MKNHQKCLITTIAGTTNAGKSTLINQLVGKKVSIVTPKAQTTRSSLRAITMVKNTQMVFIDTPGMFEARSSFDKYLKNQAWGAIGDCNVVLLLIDAKNHRNKTVVELVEQIKGRADNGATKIFMIINKADLVNDEFIKKIVSDINELHNFEEIFVISALNNLGIDNLVDYLERIAPNNPWLYPEDQLIDAPTRFLAAEITREKLFLNLNQELPYSTAVITEQMEEKKDSSLVIKQVVYVLKDNHKFIVIGNKGDMIKKVSTQSRIELEQIFEKKVHLFLYVKVCEFWQNRPQMYV